MAEPEKQEVEEELVAVETPPETEAAQEGAEAEADDERLAEGAGADADDDGDDDDGTVEVRAHRRSSNRKRRDREKRARQYGRDELETLRGQVSQLTELLSAVQGNQFQQQTQSIDQRLAQVAADVREAENHIARAITEGNGDLHVQALRLRDDAVREFNALTSHKQQIEQARQPQPRQQEDPRVGQNRQAWLRDNSDWFDANGPDAARVIAIGNQIAADGYNGATPAYWQELDRRCAAEFGLSDAPAPSRTTQAPARRKAPPTGTTREHAPTSTRREIYVSPEQKKALQEAGYWDDPKQRADALRYMNDYARDNAA